VDVNEHYSIDYEDSADMIQPGTPVVCMGLKLRTHLNGKICDIRSRDAKTKRYVVHFADTFLEPASVLPTNLYILVHLPGDNSTVEKFSDLFEPTSDNK
jgi:hypothetical protein